MNITTDYTSKKYAVGTLFPSESWGPMEILGRVGENRYAIKFLDTGYITEAGSPHINKGTVKDYYMPHVYGVGFLGKGKYKASKGSKATRAYEMWVGILERLFSGRYPTYSDVALCPRWRNFQLFCEDIQKIEGFHLWRTGKYQLDKDLSGLREYSVLGCRFISKSSNVAEANVRTRSNTTKYQVSKDGKVHNVYSIRGFCREHSINPANFHKVLKGKKRICSGWTLVG